MMVKRLAALLLCAALLGGLSASAHAEVLPGLSQEAWSGEDLQRAADYGLIEGLEDGSFQPEERLDRAFFAKMLSQMFSWESAESGTSSFTDVSPDAWYAPLAETLRAHGVVQGSAFLPGAYVTREDMAVMLVRALGYETLARDIAESGCPFADVTDYSGHIALAAAFGLTDGVESPGGRLFEPHAFLTRGQAAAMLSRVYARMTAPIDFLNGFYAFSSYAQIGLTAEMDAVSLGWSRLAWDEDRGAYLNDTAANGNDWVKPRDAAAATGYFEQNGTPYALNVYADTRQDVSLPDGSSTSVLERILPDPAGRARAVSAIVAAGVDYDGITIDFEGLRTEKLRADFTAFMAELRAALPREKTLYVCLPPDKWYHGYDFRALGEICDKVIYMVHDYQWTSVPQEYVGLRAPDSPVTPFPQVYEALAAITDPDTGVQDRSRIALQISFGTAGFEVDGDGLLKSTAIYHPAPDTIARRLRQPDTRISYDESDRNPIARYTTEEGMDVLLWYEDARSVSDKLTLARMFGITGVSLWRLGNIPDYDDAPYYDVWSAVLAQR